MLKVGTKVKLTNFYSEAKNEGTIVNVDSTTMPYQIRMSNQSIGWYSKNTVKRLNKFNPFTGIKHFFQPPVSLEPINSSIFKSSLDSAKSSIKIESELEVPKYTFLMADTEDIVIEENSGS